jgi:hypothetical protein
MEGAIMHKPEDHLDDESARLRLCSSQPHVTSRGIGTWVGRYPWRRHHGLLTIGDLIRPYLACRHPRGPYWVPLPEGLILGDQP